MVKNKENYGTMFACMSSRVVDIETTNSMGSDSFILAWRRLFTDNGTSFVAANMKRKGKESVKRNHSMKGIIPKSTGTTWRQNPPMASKMGGV